MCRNVSADTSADNMALPRSFHTSFGILYFSAFVFGLKCHSYCRCGIEIWERRLVSFLFRFRRKFDEFMTMEAIQRTETYEYAISLSYSNRQSNQAFVQFPSLQVYKFIYACRLLEYGMVEKVRCYDITPVF